MKAQKSNSVTSDEQPNVPIKPVIDATKELAKAQIDGDPKQIEKAKNDFRKAVRSVTK